MLVSTHEVEMCECPLMRSCVTGRPPGESTEGLPGAVPGLRPGLPVPGRGAAAQGALPPGHRVRHLGLR